MSPRQMIAFTAFLSGVVLAIAATVSQEIPMFIPFTVKASDTSLDQEQRLKCLCGNDVRLGDCLVCWTKTPKDPEPGWYCACNTSCVIVRLSQGHA